MEHNILNVTIELNLLMTILALILGSFGIGLLLHSALKEAKEKEQLLKQNKILRQENEQYFEQLIQRIMKILWEIQGENPNKYWIMDVKELKIKMDIPNEPLFQKAMTYLSERNVIYVKDYHIHLVQ